MIRKTFFVIAAALLASAAPLANAQQACNDPAYAKRETIAQLRDVVGNVLVSDKAGMGSAVDKQRVANNVRITTTSQAGVVVAFDCGCNVPLKANERLDVVAGQACPALLAGVSPVATNVALGSAAAGGASGGLSTPLVVGAVGVGGYLIYRNNRNVSPN
ncbi:MAG TPA: hypothetical protein PLF40_25555 [Kofleriaceae bacterium]|nr:hypothetical protein [Kofleriaceae bacterium]